MKTIVYLTCLVSLLLSSSGSIAQTKESILAESEEKPMFVKKFRWGLSWNQYWGTITGSDLQREYFSKPNIGFNLRAEYYPLSFIGVSAGFGVQQRGAGIINPDNYGGAFTHPWDVPQYDADSTYRERLRFNTVEVPLTLLLRTPKDVFKGVRLSAAAGVVLVHSWQTYDIFMSVEDGYHRITDVANDYLTNDLGYQLSGGPDINAGESCVLQVHFVYSKGMKNVYRGTGEGHLATYGVRVSWLF